MNLRIGDVIQAETDNYFIEVRILDIVLLVDNSIPGVSIEIEHTTIGKLPESAIVLEKPSIETRKQTIVLGDLLAWFKQTTWIRLS